MIGHISVSVCEYYASVSRTTIIQSFTIWDHLNSSLHTLHQDPLLTSTCLTSSPIQKGHTKAKALGA